MLMAVFLRTPLPVRKRKGNGEDNFFIINSNLSSVAFKELGDERHVF